MKPNPILPPAMLGILGGGQLGRMFTLAAKTMGYQVTILDPDPNAPAAEFADQHLCAPFDNLAALKQLSTCAAITTEFENVSADAMRELATCTSVSPSGDAVAIAQNRILEKRWIAQADLETAPYAIITTAKDCQQDLTALFPALLKTATLGYDGKGQIRIDAQLDLQAAFKQVGSVPCVLEKILPLHKELSVILARSEGFETQCFPVIENQHKNGILDLSIVPARISKKLQERAQNMAIRLANELDYIGVLAVEFFLLANDSLIINEIAPRPHNSGHFTLNACATDQFQQQVRALCHLPLGNPKQFSPCVMVNLLGDIWLNGQTDEPNWFSIFQSPHTYLHLYGKKQARKGRKMGHFTTLGSDLEVALNEVLAIQNKLK